MPLIYVQRYGQTAIAGAATQYIESGGAFNLNGYMAFELDPTVFTTKGKYVLVDYSLGTFAWTGAYATGQAALDALAIVDMTLMPSTWTATLNDDAGNKLITVTLS